MILGMAALGRAMANRLACHSRNSRDSGRLRSTVLATLLAMPLGAYAQRVPSRLPAPDGYVDPTPHKPGFITVQRGVRIHYLDFGGTGPALLLVPGIGNTAHA